MDLALLIVADKGLELMCVKTVTIDLLITADMTLAFLQLENNQLNIRGWHIKQIQGVDILNKYKLPNPAITAIVLPARYLCNFNEFEKH